MARKQIPFATDFYYDGDFEEYDYRLDLDKTHPQIRNAYIRVNKSAIDPSQKYSLVKRPGFLQNEDYFNPGASPPTGAFYTLCDGAQVQRGGGNVDWLVTLWSTGAGGPLDLYLNNTKVTLPAAYANAGPGVVVDLEGPLASGAYGNNKLWVNCLNRGFVVDYAGTVTDVTDVDFLAIANKTNAVAFDGYIFVADINTGYIYNSDLNAPTAWAASSRLQANLFPGYIIRLMRAREFLVAFKSRSIEFFVDAGNAAPGSPLDPKPEYVRQYGAVSSQYIKYVADGIVWLGTDPSGKLGVFKLSFATFEITEISTPVISKWLMNDQVFKPGATNALISTYHPGRFPGMSVLEWEGKELISVPTYWSGNKDPYNFLSLRPGTPFYDSELNLWYLWTFGTSTSAQPILMGYVAYGVPLGDTTPSRPYVNIGRDSNSILFCEFDPNTYQDYVWTSGTMQDFEVRWTATKMDFGSNKRKFMASFEAMADVTVNTAQSSTTSIPDATPDLTFAYNDYDASGTSTTPVSKSLSLTGIARAIWRRLGSFRTRMLSLSYINNAPLKLMSGEVQVTMPDVETD